MGEVWPIRVFPGFEKKITYRLQAGLPEHRSCSKAINSCMAVDRFQETPADRYLNQCLYNVGPSSTTLAQHYTNTGSMSLACWVDIAFPQVTYCSLFYIEFLVNLITVVLN